MGHYSLTLDYWMDVYACGAIAEGGSFALYVILQSQFIKVPAPQQVWGDYFPLETRV